MNLFEIDQAILDCIDAETGEVIDIDALNELMIERDTKIENVCLWIKNLSAEEKALKEEKQQFEKRQKAVANKIAGLKGWLALALNYQKFKTVKCSVSFRTTESTVIEDVNLIPDEYVEISRDPKKQLIKEAIKNGVEVKGATLQANTSVIIK